MRSGGSVVASGADASLVVIAIISQDSGPEVFIAIGPERAGLRTWRGLAEA